MDGALGEKGGLVCKDFVENELAAVLGDHARDKGTVRNKIEFWGPRVRVRGVHSTRTKETGGCKKKKRWAG